MAVRGVGGGRKGGGVGGARGAGPATKAGGVGFADKVGKSESLVGPSGVVGSSNVGAVAAADPVTAQALDIARQLKSGQIKTKEEATKKLVADILKEKVRMQSKALTQYITEHLEEDPLSKQILEQIWTKGASDKEQD